MSTIAEIDAELAAIKKKLSPLLLRQSDLKHDRGKLQSQAFIAANNITVNDVELSEGNDKPWFVTLEPFVTWLKSRPSHKRWTEWNGVIYFTTDLLNGRQPDDMPGRIEDLKTTTESQHAHLQMR